MLLEVCAYNITSCMIAQQAGAGRIELCSDPAAGGTTPSHGLIAYALEQLAIPVYPMIRPRGGNFIYSKDELELMRRDILHCKELGCTGIATGVQRQDKTIDVDAMARLVEWAYPMEVTCHKVFDRVPDSAAALEAIISAGCVRLLTSGLGATAIEGAAVLQQLIQQASGRIVIMPGGGVRSGNIAALVQATKAGEYHSSGLSARSTDHIADADEIRELVRLLQ